MKASHCGYFTDKTEKRCLEDAAGFCLLSENEMVRSNALKALTTLDTPRARGYMKYLEIPTGLFQYQAENSQ